METMTFNWRYWVLTFIGFLAFACIAGMPQDSNPHYWTIVVCSKVAGIIFAMLGYCLYMKFAQSGKIDNIIEYLENDDDE